MTIKNAYNELCVNLEKIYDKREAESIADWVIEHITGKKRWERRLNDELLNPQQEKKLRKYTQQLLTNKPVQYVLNESFFYGLKFFVNEDVLIPRPETEELVALVINEFKDQKKESEPHILEVGTGSGCISIAIQSRLPKAKITAIDKSRGALEVARRNASTFNQKVDFLLIDFLHAGETAQLGSYDAIVSNPPYIPKKEKEMLAKNVTEFEPELALFVPQNDPLLFYKAIISFAKNHLEKNGKVFVEIHENYASETCALFIRNGFSACILKDIYGKERMIKASII